VVGDRKYSQPNCAALTMSAMVLRPSLHVLCVYSAAVRVRQKLEALRVARAISSSPVTRFGGDERRSSACESSSRAPDRSAAPAGDRPPANHPPKALCPHLQLIEWAETRYAMRCAPAWSGAVRCNVTSPRAVVAVTLAAFVV
jgi:hypothetical protein